MPRFLPFQRYLLPLIWVALITLTLLSLARSTYLTMGRLGGLDLNAYWYYGHFVRMGINPYTAYQEHQLLPEPAHYLDGTVVTPEEVPIFGGRPAHTASTLLIASLLSYIPWTPLKYIGFFFNLALLIVMPWLALRLLPPSLQLVTGLKWLAAFSFYATKGTRVALSTGQPSIAIFTLTILSLLLRQNHWFWSGLALGVALGKYSISIPIAIFMLFEKRFRVLAVAALVQLVSLLGVGMLQEGSIMGTVQQYWNLAAGLSSRVPSVHLGYLFYNYPVLGTALIVLITGATMVYAWRHGVVIGIKAADVLPLNSLLALWILLAAYHREYDIILVLFFLIVALSALTTWRLSELQVQWLAILWMLSLFMVCLPGEILKSFFSESVANSLARGIGWLTSAALVAMWSMNLWLLPKVPRDAESKRSVDQSRN